MDPRLIFLIVTGIITLVVCSIWWYSYGCEDMEDFFFENGWLPLSICLVLGGIIYGFVFWLWWAMLLIMIPILVIIIVLCISDGNDKKDRKEKYKSIFKCEQCGANLIKESEGGNTLYYCQYCDTKYSEKELKEQYHKEQNGKNNDYDLTDFEKEYFEMCWVLNISPQEVHSEKQIEHKYNVFSAKIGNGSITYDDDDFDDEDVLYNAYDYFCENIDEINDYINLNNPTDIKKRYQYYLDVSGKENISE